MKFGKRFLAAQKGLKSGDDFLDYKLMKRCIKQGIQNGDKSGSAFSVLLREQLSKLDTHYVACETKLKAAFDEVEQKPIAEARHAVELVAEDAAELLHFAALNYVAVVKAVKKRNKHLHAAFGDDAKPVPAISFLASRQFFTSKVLTEVSVGASLMMKKVAGTYNKSFKGSGEGSIDDYTCPICLSLLQSPVVLTCTHTFCWHCITTYCLQVVRDEGVARRVLSRATDVLASDTDERSELPSADASAVIDEDAKTHEEQTHVDAIQDWHEVWSSVLEDGQPHEFACPVCRKQQILDLNGLSINAELNATVEQLAAWRGTEGVEEPCVQRQSQAADSGGRVVLVPEEKAAPPPRKSCSMDTDSSSPENSGMIVAEATGGASVGDPVLLQPQSPEHAGKLTIVLDLDGTLISSFPPRRAPAAGSMRTHLVGQGSKLNPQGVFVVERPGLPEFLKRASELGELVVFTAGLADYALPIIAVIDPDGTFFGSRVICRTGTTAAREYPCVKDLSRLDRPPARTLIVDDTPLAFLWQPAQGVPVLGFGGDPSDTLLLDAVLPLLELASEAADVRPFLDGRFGMASWFASHGYCTEKPRIAAGASAADLRQAAAGSRSSGSSSGLSRPSQERLAAGSAEAIGAVAASIALRSSAAHIVRGGRMILCDFDKTLVDFDVAERVTEALAPELLPMLMAVQSPANFVPVYNAIFEEMRNRGVSTRRMLDCLHELGSEVPPSIVQALEAVTSESNTVIRVLSNANDVFVNSVLEGAGAKGHVHDVIANSATFVRAGSDARRDVVDNVSGHPGNSVVPETHKLVVSPVHPHTQPHSCSLCPESLCKGMHVKALLPYHNRIMFCCDGANDLCALLCLRAGDGAYVRRDYACHHLLMARERKAQCKQPACAVKLWSTHDELAAAMRQFTKARRNS